MTSPSLQLARARQRLAADAQIARAAARLHEEHVLEAADLDAARDAFEHDVGVVRRTERDGQLGGAEFVPPPRSSTVTIEFRPLSVAACVTRFFIYPAARWVRRRPR